MLALQTRSILHPRQVKPTLGTKDSGSVKKIQPQLEAYRCYGM